jgi:hypothetical protein
MASARLSRVEKVVAYRPLCDLGADQRHEFHEALLESDSFEDLPGKWQAAILAAEQNRELRVVNGQRLLRQPHGFKGFGMVPEGLQTDNPSVLQDPNRRELGSDRDATGLGARRSRGEQHDPVAQVDQLFRLDGWLEQKLRLRSRKLAGLAACAVRRGG